MRSLLAALALALAAHTWGDILGFDAAGGRNNSRSRPNSTRPSKPPTSHSGCVDSPRGRITRAPEHGELNVETMADWFTSWGYETEITSYEILIPRPTERQLVLETPTRFVASLTERPMMSDPSSRFAGDMLPPYNSYSPDGDVRGNVVYVNYGRIEDYEMLARYGVDVGGKIVIARYGATFRGMKPKIAAMHGAIGCIIYSDPIDDGYYQGRSIPTDPIKMRRAFSAARSWTCRCMPVTC